MFIALPRLNEKIRLRFFIDKLPRKEKSDLSAIFSALKDSELLDEIEEDSKRIRASARSRV
ncbi:MAG: hypothetical protein A4E44_00707 [Methanosaeta sp. PtaB.Bin018]|jgi:hypothetical protein|nr:MAG: hypothetical protein A4E44_00707 [Methanosaeta sp. PtaB.Bin018]OPY47225.1 MAG: hypothetical protein A4E46_00569 [Methanosaeta sp. PtaU1.Bin016]